MKPLPTPLERNPENQPLEKQIPFGNQHFSGSLLNFGGVATPPTIRCYQMFQFHLPCFRGTNFFPDRIFIDASPEKEVKLATQKCHFQKKLKVEPTEGRTTKETQHIEILCSCCEVLFTVQRIVSEKGFSDVFQHIKFLTWDCHGLSLYNPLILRTSSPEPEKKTARHIDGTSKTLPGGT